MRAGDRHSGCGVGGPARAVGRLATTWSTGAESDEELEARLLAPRHRAHLPSFRLWALTPGRRLRAGLIPIADASPALRARGGNEILSARVDRRSPPRAGAGTRDTAASLVLPDRRCGGCPVPPPSGSRAGGPSSP